VSQTSRFLKNVFGSVQKGLIELVWLLVWSLLWFLIGFGVDGREGAVLLGIFFGVFGYFPFGKAITGWFRKHWRQAKEAPRK